MILKHDLFAALKALPAVSVLVLALMVSACCKDDPEPGPGPEPPDPPDPPTPVVPDTPRRVALSLLARPAGDDPEPWSVADTLHVVLTAPDGRTALGDTALYRYAFPEPATHPERFIPASATDSAFLPADSSLVDLMAYRPASVDFQRDRLRLPVDTRRLTATGRPLMTASRTVGICAVQSEASIVLSHQLTRLYVKLNMVTAKSAPHPAGRASETDEIRIILHGNPAHAVWSLPDETFVEYGDTLPQPFAMQSDRKGGYLYTLPSWPGEGEKPLLWLTVLIPGREPLDIPLNEYLPQGLLEIGTSIDIRIDVPPIVDPKPAPWPDPYPPPPDRNTIRIKVTQTDWEDIIYDQILYPDENDE